MYRYYSFKIYNVTFYMAIFQLISITVVVTKESEFRIFERQYYNFIKIKRYIHFRIVGIYLLGFTLASI